MQVGMYINGLKKEKDNQPMIKKKPDEKWFNESPRDLPLPWFRIGHGIDNYEEGIDLSKVMSFRVMFKLIPNSDVWDAHREAVFSD